MVFTVDELKDHNFRRKNKSRAIKHLNMMHNLLNLNKDHAEYFQKNADPKIRMFMFSLTIATDYLNYSNFHIQQALFSQGLNISETGGSSGARSYVNYKKGKMKYEDVVKKNKEISELAEKKSPNIANQLAMSYDMAYENMQNPDDPNSMMGKYVQNAKNAKDELDDLGYGGMILYEAEYKAKPKYYEYLKEEAIMKKYLDVFKSGKISKRTASTIDKCIENYRNLNKPKVARTNHAKIINDIKSVNEDKNIINDNMNIINDNKIIINEIKEEKNENIIIEENKSKKKSGKKNKEKNENIIIEEKKAAEPYGDPKDIAYVSRKREAMRKPKVRKDASLMTDTDKKMELDKFYRINGRFTEPSYKLYNFMQSSDIVYKDKKINSRLKTALKKGAIKNKKNAGTDGAVGALLRFVNYDMKKKPLTDIDEENAAWNEKLISAYEKNDTETREMMIREELPMIFKDIKLPFASINDKSELWIKEWMDNVVKEEPGKYFSFLRKVKSFRPLIEESEEAKKFFDSNPKYKAVLEAADILVSIISDELKVNAGFDPGLEKGAELKIFPAATKGKPDPALIPAKNLEKNIDLYTKTVNKILNDNPDNDIFMSELDEDQYEYAVMHKEQPLFNEKGYEIYKKKKEFMRTAKTNPIMLAEYEKAKKNFNSIGKSSVDRSAYFGMKDVRYDRNWNPVEEDKEKHEWNMKFLKAWQEKDAVTAENMVEEMLPDAFEGIEFPPVPTEEEMLMIMQSVGKESGDYKRRLDDWAKRQVENNYQKLLKVAGKTLSIDGIRNSLPSVKKFTDVDNPLYKIRSDIFSYATLYTEGWIQEHYFLKSNGEVATDSFYKGDDEEKMKRLIKEQVDASQPAFLMMLAMQIPEYNKHKDDKPKPLVKQGKITA